MTPVGTVCLSQTMRARIQRESLDEQQVYHATQEAFMLLLHPVMMHYSPGGTDRLPALLASGLVDVNALAPLPLRFKFDDQDHLETGLLHLAAIHMKPDIVRLLCAHGADANVRNSDGHTPLYNVCYDDIERVPPYSIRAGKVYHDTQKKLISALIDNGADPHIAGKGGRSLATDAVYTHDWILLEQLMKAGVNMLTYPDSRSCVLNEVMKLQEEDTEKPRRQDQQDAFDTVIKAMMRLKMDCQRQLQKHTPPITQPEQVTLFANAGMLEELFDQTRWHGHEVQAFNILASLPPYMQTMLEGYKEYYSLGAFLDERRNNPTHRWTDRLHGNTDPSSPPPPKQR